MLGGSAALYGFSSGAVLALRAAAALPGKCTRLAVFEPPFNADDDHARAESAAYVERMSLLLGAGKRSEAVELFLQDMLPTEVIRSLEQSPEWEAMEAVAPTLAYDNAVLGDGTVPVAVARSVSIPVLVLDGAESPPFKHAAALALARALPRAESRTLPGQDTLAPADVVAPILRNFVGRS